MEPWARTGEHKGIPLLHLAGVLDYALKPELRAVLAQTVAAGPCLILDFSEVTFVDSSALGLLIDLDDRLSARGGALAIASLQKDVGRVFQIAGLARLLKVFVDLDKAAAYLKVACGLEES